MIKDCVKKKDKGFTLIELLVAVAIGAIFIAALYSYFLNSYRAYMQRAEMQAIENEAKKLNESIQQWLSMSDQTTIDSTYDSATGRYTVSMEVYQTDNFSNAGFPNPDFRTKIIYDPQQSCIVVEKYDLGSGVGGPVPTMVAYQYLVGKVKNFNVFYRAGERISITYDVIIKNRLYGSVKRTYKIDFKIRLY